MKPNVIKVDIEEVRGSEYPCMDHCKKLLKKGVDSNSRLECWNYKREEPEADWTVPNIGEYVKNEKYLRNKRFRSARFVME